MRLVDRTISGAATSQRFSVDDEHRDLIVDTTQGHGAKVAAERLLAVMAHEVRTPLNSLNNVTALLESSPGDVNNVLNCVQIMRRQISRMARLVSELFEFTAATQGKLAFSPVPISINNLMKDVTGDISCEIESKNQTFNLGLLDQDLQVMGDYHRLTQIFVNLISNASKYTQDQGSISFIAKRGPGCVFLEIADNGIGIAKSSLENVFNLFAQESGDNAKHGLGLGLALVKKLVELHGGDVYAVSEGLGHGSMFVVRLPVHHPIEDADQENVEMKRILIVEDNKDTATALKTIMTLHGHDVHAMNTGGDAIKDAMCWLPEVVLLDLGLPDMAGEDVGRMIKDSMPGVHVVAMSGYPTPETHDGWCDHYIVKPINLPSLMHILNNHDTVPA